MSLYCEMAELKTESDVEQKFIYPFLTFSSPLGLGIDGSQIFTKSLLRKTPIGKGQTRKYYYPDYLVSIRGIPVLVVEAKNPNEDLCDGYSEARLYAQEINAHFPHNVNACQFVVASNGLETWVGYFDQALPLLKLSINDMNAENTQFVETLKLCAIEQLEIMANKPYLTARGKSQFYTPVSKLGGNRVQNEELEENTFGRTFVFENRRIFDPETEDDRAVIVTNAYISSAKREQHIEPIYREIRKFELPSIKSSTPLATDEPTELVNTLSQRINLKNDAYSLVILVGNVGSGKTTFVRYFQRVFLSNEHPELSRKCDWVFLNMNSAPHTKSEIYDWMKVEFLSQLKRNHQNIDVESIDVIKRIFRKEILSFESGIGTLLKNDSNAYNKELFNMLREYLGNSTMYLGSFLNFLKSTVGSLPIVVLDNCDKRNKDDQLLMFEIAQWLRTTFKCVVILPLRDSTYDQYKDEPPLDTVVKDLVFRIDPPDLLKVLQARLDYIVRTTEKLETTFELENGISVIMKKTELLEYFKCIMIAIRTNKAASDIFYKLSDRNTRKGIQLFEDFCKSGHVKADDIFRIRTAGTDYELPLHIFLNALLRKNRRFYNGEYSNFVNLFSSSHSDDFPDPFIRVDILIWLKSHGAKPDYSRTHGMFNVDDIARDMQLIGHKIAVFYREIEYLTRKNLIVSESLSDTIQKGDLVKITLSGSLHLNLLNNITYLAACAEDILFKNTNIMTSITRRLSLSNYLSRLSVVLTTRDMLQYLVEYRKEYYSNPSSYYRDGDLPEIYDLQDCISSLESVLSADKYIKTVLDNISLFAPGSQVSVQVVHKSKNSLVCRFVSDPNIKGFLSTFNTQYRLSASEYFSIQEQDILLCEILEFDFSHNSFQLKFISISENSSNKL